MVTRKDASTKPHTQLWVISPTLESYTAFIKQDSQPTLSLINLDIVDSITLLKQSDKLLAKTIESEVIDRLTQNTDIAAWVENGTKIHKNHSSKFCEYCLQEIPHVRLTQLARHFNESDKNLKDEIDQFVRHLQDTSQAISALQLPSATDFYKEIRENADERIRALSEERDLVIAGLNSLIEEVSSKKLNTHTRISSQVNLDFANLMEDISLLNNIISEHNNKTIDFENLKEARVTLIKNHYLSTIYEEVNNIQKEISDLNSSLTDLETEINQLQNRIANNKSRISSEHKACEILNKCLWTFLGRREVTFCPNEENGSGESKGPGYCILRGTEPAVHLSEGEKTAIAFIYFIVHLQDEDFDPSKGIVVIDDPISSLDSNSLYQAFSFLKNAVKGSGQVFVCTHNYDFLKLLLNWRQYDGKADTSHYMLKNRFHNGLRCAYLDKMDKELIDFSSEYHYLYKVLRNFQTDTSHTIAISYPIPNIARKVWETFLLFNVPVKGSQSRKMDVLKDEGFDKQKLDAIYKFTNDQSHITGSGFNPSLVPESQKVVKELFEMIEVISPRHYRIIESTIA